MVVKLTKDHHNMMVDIFSHNQHMAVTVKKQDDFNNAMRAHFCNTYLTNLDNFHAFGIVENNKVVTLISFYESIDEPSWYNTSVRNIGDPKNVRDVLDIIIEYNEKNGRLKWYSLINKHQQPAIRRFYLSKDVIDRYDYVDEYTVNARQKTFFNQHWEILFKRILLPTDTIVRCSYLKNKYRTILPNLGNI